MFLFSIIGCPISTFFLLPEIQPIVLSLRFKQLLMAPALHDPPLTQHIDHIRILYRREPVCNRDHGHVPGELPDRINNPLLGYIIKRTRRLIQKQDLRVSEDNSGYRHPLPLAARELHPLVADDGIIATIGSHDEAMGIGTFAALIMS